MADAFYLVCAIACRELGRKKEMNHWFRQAVAFGRKDRVILPFLGYWHGKGSPLHQIVLEQAPELMPDLDRLTVVYLKNMIRFHNHFTGESTINFEFPLRVSAGRR